jgi:hypothetical protein
MAPPRKRKGGPITEGRPATKDIPPVAKRKDTPSAMVRQGESSRTAVTVRVTLLPPSGRRSMFWALGRCPLCGLPHLSRSRDLESVTRTRQLPCGHWVTVVIARSLAPYAGSEAA